MRGLISSASCVTEIEERRVHGIEYALYHPARGSIVSLTAHSLQEIDATNGALMGETHFDLLLLSEKPANAATSGRHLDLLVPVGRRHVAAIYQARYCVVWDLEDMVLQSISELEKQQKSIVGMAASLCKDQWLFYTSEGSNSIKVTCVDSKELPKKISRKATNRSSLLTCLSYDTARRLLGAGASDGSLQLWIFSEENTLGGKEDAAVVTPVLTAQSTPAPVVHLSFQDSGATTYWTVGYQNRVVEVWNTSPSPQTRQKEPFRVATVHGVPPQTADFARKSGELSCLLHPQLPLLGVAWQSHLAGGGSYASAMELRFNNQSPVTLSDWHELLPASHAQDEGNTAVLYWSKSSTATLAAYQSTIHQRQLAALALASAQMTSAAAENTILELSMGFQLSFDQYFKYRDIPSMLLQVAKNPESTATTFQLQRVSVLTGEVEKIDDLPVWNNYQGRQLLPWRVRANEQQTAVCIQLQDPTKAFSPSDQEDTSFFYAVAELSTKAAADNDGGGSSVQAQRGAPLEALDVCFCDLRSEDAKQKQSYVLIALATTGKSLCFQMTRDQIDSDSRVLLQRPVRRVFPTPLALSAASPYVTLVGSRLLYMVKSDLGLDTLLMSEDDLSVSRGSGWSVRSAAEKIIDVRWNGGLSSPVPDTDMLHLVAVWTNQRVVILSATLTPVVEYSLESDLETPQSLLWVAQTLLFVTSSHQLRYVTPLRSNSASILLCSLPASTSTTQKLQLLSLCGDRICFAASDTTTLDCKTYLRPMAIYEPLLMGFTKPNERLKGIFEREALAFVLSGGQETLCPITSRVLETIYHEFGWTETTRKVLETLLNASSSSASSSSGGSSGGAGAYRRTSHLPPTLIISLLLHEHKWKDAMRVLLQADPALEEYALADDDSGASSKLPSRTGQLAQHFQRFAAVLAELGQYDLALRCLDIAGDDVAILELFQTLGVGSSAPSVANALQKDWATLNPALSALAKAMMNDTQTSDSGVWRRHDLFSLLCCERVTQTERRSRLLASVKPFDKFSMSVTKPENKEKVSGPAPRASLLLWKRLAPEDAKDVIGNSLTPHFNPDEPKSLNYTVLHGALAASGGESSADGGAADNGGFSGASSDASATAKMTIGPFLEDEDAVVAYWRFEEGGTANDDDTPRTLESMDTSKRENHLQILQFASLMKLAASTAPVDKGEDGKLQEEYSLRFPPSDGDSSVSGGDWGAKCSVRPGNTLDIGFVFDEDPYRRKFTFEAWIRNHTLFKTQQEAENDGDGGEDDYGTGSRRTASQDGAVDSQLRRLVCRRGVDGALWWEFSVHEGFLVLSFAGHTMKSEERVANLASWQHVAFSIDITSPKNAMLKLFVQARCVGTKEITTVESNAKLMSAAIKTLSATAVDPDASGLPPPLSTIHLGHQLRDFELTEVRLWATARTAEQLSDMKENYLGIAETKRRMKITIHQRNCQCEKCIGRRTKPAAAGRLTLGTPFPSTPPSSSTVRNRRRPQPKA
ncbi:hypothetical protein Poli38472_003990 [Pythium oligandrum]|uniref:Uncharacterized protein n=1 Tax=Pythium oligandrum TaxID=41045 RepID=A0A8K1FJM7_PYTOL|nr:hypothetical protein Poli38472_003990 [Pythium oligandrum]|eukprot:TMW66225.1 hypothetical protein Poli38472_003990 [Pythium oligandrum]